MPHKSSSIEGVPIPSVTQIIKVMDQPWKWGWYRNSVQKFGKLGWAKNDLKSRVGMEVGTVFHEGVYDYLTKGKFPSKEAQTYPMVRQFADWWKQAGFGIVDLEPEKPLISKKYRFAGTYDGILKNKKIPGILIPVDWKSSNSIDKTYGIQISAYAYLKGEELGLDEEDIWEVFPNGLVLRVDKRPEENYKLEEKWFYGLKYYFEIFKALREAYDFIHSEGGWEKP